MSVAALVLGIVAIVLAALTLTWQVAEWWARRPRVSLTPVVGLTTPDGLLTMDAGHDVRDALAHAARKLPRSPLVVGVTVVNAGRVPVRIDGWSLRSDPGGAELAPEATPHGGTAVPYDLAPGGSAVFIVEMLQARHFTEAAFVDGQPPQLTLAVAAGSHTYVTKPVAPELLLLDVQ